MNYTVYPGIMSPRISYPLPAFVKSKPLGLFWRSHYWYTTAVIGFGISVDILIYSLLIPVIPFRLEILGYERVPALVSYMLFAFSSGLVISTLPIAWYSERFSSRRGPLNVGMALMIGCQFMLMFAPTYWLMILARILQGIGGSMIWIAGLALVCDMTPPEHIGRQLGFVMAGFSVGMLLGPTIGGALYDRFGWYGPLIFGIISLAVDLIGRLLIIDRDEALKYNVDPRVIHTASQVTIHEKGEIEINELNQAPEASTSWPNPTGSEPVTIVKNKRLSLVSVFIQMVKSPGALVPLICAFIDGFILAMEETAIPLHLKDAWHLNSTKIGLIFLAGAVPPLLGAPLAGWISDKWGTELTIPIFFLFAVPWWCVLIIEKALALFIVAATLQTFFTSSVSAPIMAQLAGASDKIEGVGYAHVYGAFNLVYGVGSAIGLIITGQIYEHSAQGWLIICIIGAATMLAAAILTTCFCANAPLLTRFKARSGKDGLSDSEGTNNT